MTMVRRSFTLTGINRSPLETKKWRAEWSDGKHTDFGATGYSDFTIHKDVERRNRYRRRHAGDRLDDPKSPGALSMFILWGDSTDMEECIRAFRRRFGV
jgi:hypothetical protein